MKAFLWDGYFYRYVGLIDKDTLVAVEVIPKDENPLVGDIYMGRIAKAIPSQEVYFVDIGEEQLAYLQGRDIAKPIGPSDALNVGDWVLVQVKHEAHGNKGPKVTDKLSLQGKWTVLLTGEHKVMASQKIRDTLWRTETLKAISESSWMLNISQTHMLRDCGEHLGLILRTEAHLVALETLYDEVSDLMEMLSQWGWQKLSHKRGLVAGRYYRPKEAWRLRLESWLQRGGVLYTNSKLEASHYQLKGVHVVSGGQPLIDLHCTSHLDLLIKRAHQLPGGATIVVDELEALTAIDVNSASFKNNYGNLSNTQLAINLTVLPQLCRLMDLRALSGMILVDFVNMEPSEEKTLLRALQVAVKASGLTDVEIKGFTKLGILEITRKRQGQSLLKLLGANTVIEGERLLSGEYLWDQVLLEIDAARYTCDAVVIHIFEGIFESFMAHRLHMRAWLQTKGEHLPEIYIKKCGLSRQFIRLERLNTAIQPYGLEALRWI